MELVTVKELYKHREQYLDKKLQWAAGFAVSEIQRHLDLLL